MVIDNQTSHNLSIDGRILEPNSRRYVTEHMFNTVNVSSDRGSVVIKSDYYLRNISADGHLGAYESDELDSNGHNVVIIKEC